MKRTYALLLALSIPMVAYTQSAHDRHMAEAEASGQVRAVSGGTTITVSGTYENVFDRMVKFLNVQGMAVESASKDSGLIGTAMETVKKKSIFGGEFGTRAIVTIIRDSDTQTMVRVAITHQKRDTGFGKFGPWDHPTVDAKASDELAEKLKNAS